MKRSILIALALFTLTAGCQNMGKYFATPLEIIQFVFNSTLPKTFKGPWYGRHKNPFFDVTIDAGGLIYNETIAQWEFSWLIYERNDHIATWSSEGKLVFGSPPVTPGR